MKWFHVHRWTLWGDPFAFGFDAYQRVRCSRCGKIKQRKVGLATELELRRQHDEVDPPGKGFGAELARIGHPVLRPDSAPNPEESKP